MAESAAAVAQSHAAMAEARRKVDDARRQIFMMSAVTPDGRHDLEWRGMTPEQRDRVRASIDEAMKHAELAINGPDDGRVPMRCKIGPDGKGTDCVPFRGPIAFGLHREGPPAPPAPGAPPAPPAPPAVG